MIVQMSDLMDSMLKTGIMNMFKELKKIMINELKKVTMCHQQGSINKEIQIIKNNQKENWSSRFSMYNT